MKLIRTLACLLAFGGIALTATAAPAKAVKANTPDPAAITTSQADEILAELRAIKAMLEEDRKAAEPSNGNIRLPTHPSRWSNSRPISAPIADASTSKAGQN